VRQCLLPESCHDLIFWAWIWQSHKGREIDPFVDPERRRRLTRERLPVDDEEFQPLLLECLADYPAALATALPQLELDGQLQQLVIEERTATARLVVESVEPLKDDDPRGKGIAFRKDEHGWRIDYFGYPIPLNEKAAPLKSMAGMPSLVVMWQSILPWTYPK
jgi:hypothetical protein